MNVLRQSRANLRGFIPSMLMINDFIYQINNNYEFIDEIFRKNPPKPGDDLEGWMTDNHMYLKKVSPLERIKDYTKDKIKLFKNKKNLNETCEDDTVMLKYDFHNYDNDCEKIIKSLNKKEFDHINGGYWIRSDHLYYRKVEYINNKPAGFIDIYTLPKFKNAGLITLAVNKNYRGRGLSKKLVNNAIVFAKNDNKLYYLRWLADKDNDISMNLAKSCGFKQTNIGSNEVIFEYPLKGYSTDLKKIQSKVI